MRLDQLRQHLLHFLPAPPSSRLSYSPAELDATRAYIVLAHAEIEAFCEGIALAKATALKARFDTTGIVTPCLRRIIAYHIGNRHHCWSEVLNPSAAYAEKAFRFYKGLIHDNNGIKLRNLQKIMFPIGIFDSDLDPVWTAQMDSFGVLRGGWAHAGIATQRPPDPLTQLTAVNQLIYGLLTLDRTIAGLQ